MLFVKRVVDTDSVRILLLLLLEIQLFIAARIAAGAGMQISLRARSANLSRFATHGALEALRPVLVGAGLNKCRGLLYAGIYVPVINSHCTPIWRRSNVFAALGRTMKNSVAVVVAAAAGLIDAAAAAVVVVAVAVADVAAADFEMHLPDY